MLYAIILAAGESRRMGEPKAIVRFGEKTFLENILDNLTAAGIPQQLIVLGCDRKRIVRVLRLSPQQYVENRRYRSGQFSSFQTAIRSLPAEAGGAMLCLVDQPQIRVETLKRLQLAFRATPENIIIPVFAGKRGHPTIFPQWLFADILEAPPQTTAREIIHAREQHVREVAVPDESILWNINTPGDLRRAESSLHGG